MQSLLSFVRRRYAPAHPNATGPSIRQVEIAVARLDQWHRRRGPEPIRPSDLSRELLQEFLRDYAASVAPATANGKRAHLMAVWRLAFEDGQCPNAPKKIERFKANCPVPEAWRSEQFDLILAVASEEEGEISGIPAAAWWRSFLLALYYTGERVGAMARVPSRDLEFAAPGMLAIMAQGINVRRRKNGEAKFHALPDDAMGAILAIYDPDRPLLWPIDCCRETRDERFRRILTRAGVAFGRSRGGLWHKIRRTSGSLVEAAGGDGSRHLGNTRQVFERHYRDPRICGGSQVSLLPPPAPIGRPRLRVV